MDRRGIPPLPQTDEILTMCPKLCDNMPVKRMRESEATYMTAQCRVVLVRRVPAW